MDGLKGFSIIAKGVQYTKRWIERNQDALGNHQIDWHHHIKTRKRNCFITGLIQVYMPHARWDVIHNPYVTLSIPINSAKFRAIRHSRRIYKTLFPLTKQSPYFLFNCPFTYSSVCSSATFIYPSKHVNSPARQRSSKSP